MITKSRIFSTLGEAIIFEDFLFSRGYDPYIIEEKNKVIVQW